MKQNLIIHFLSNSEEIIKANDAIKYTNFLSDKHFDDEIKEIQKHISIRDKKNSMICQNWKDISLCISSHLICESYYKLKKDRLLNLNNNQNQEKEQPISILN